MNTASISDALSRVSAIEQQLRQLQDGGLLASALGSSAAGESPGSGAAAPAGATSTPSFTDALAQAAGATTGGTSGTAVAGLGGQTLTGVVPDGLTTGSSATAPSGAASALLTSGQQRFAATLSADTGLNPSVVSAWLLAEESGGAAQSRQAQGNNDWLNVGYTDSGTYGAADQIWSDPVTAANATAAWLQGQDAIPGYGTASSGVQSILASVGQTPAAQLQAIQSSGWSSGGYPSLDALYGQVTT